MPLIEGVGDEVVWFISLVLGAMIALLAWWSTGYRQDRYRTVVVLDRNMRHIYRAFVQHPVSFSIRRNTASGSSEVNNSANVNLVQDIPLRGEIPPPNIVPVDPVANNIPENESNDESERSVDTEGSDLASTEQIAEMESIVNAMDSESSLRNRRVTFFEQQMRTEPATGTTTTATNVAPSRPESNAESLPRRLAKMMNRNRPSMPADSESLNATQVTEKESDLEGEIPIETSDIPPVENEPVDDASPRTGDNIRIRLKYLNDDQKLVEASLQEQLGDFKKRHFRRELANRGSSLVRLIFAGRLLREAETLRDAGLYDNCVVHCLIQEPRNQTNMPDGSTLNTGQNDTADPQGVPPDPTNNNNNASRDWDLGHAFFTLMTMLITGVWYFHFQYSHMFGAAATVGLLGLTGLYAIAVISVYYPDDHLEFTPPATPQNTART